MNVPVQTVTLSSSSRLFTTGSSIRTTAMAARGSSWRGSARRMRAASSKISSLRRS
jgi:hypothetical protein